MAHDIEGIRAYGVAGETAEEQRGNGALASLPPHLTISCLEPDTTVVRNNQVYVPGIRVI